MSINRRQFVVGSGTVLIGAIGVGAGTNVLADEHEIPVVIASVNPMEDTVVLENVGNDTVDLGGYQLDWEHADDETQTDAFDGGVTIEPGGQLVVWSGFQSEQIDAVDYDHQIAEYEDGRINDEEPDVIALLSPSGEVVATSDGAVRPPEPEPPGDEEEEEEDDGAGEDEEETEEDGEGAEDTDEEDDTEATDEDGEKEQERETDEDDC